MAEDDDEPLSRGDDATQGVGRFKHKRSHAFQPGNVVAGRYRVLHLIAQGGMAEVYAVFDDTAGEYRALKTLQLKFRDNTEVTRRAEAEARMLLRMRHDHLVRVFDAGIDGGRLFFVMPLLEGCDLREFLLHNKALPIGVALDLVFQLANAVRALHGVYVLHRDLKPENAFVSPRPDGTRHLRLLDLGAAKFYREHVTTHAGSSMGTLQYMSPEQASGETRLGADTDIYALGIILWELIAGMHPAQLHAFPPLVVGDWTDWHRDVAKPLLTAVVPAAPVPLVRFIASCLAPLERRTPNMALVLNALAELRRQFGTLGCEAGSSVSFPEPTKERRAVGQLERHQVNVASRVTPQLPYARTEEHREVHAQLVVRREQRGGSVHAPAAVAAPARGASPLAPQPTPEQLTLFTPASFSRAAVAVDAAAAGAMPAPGPRARRASGAGTHHHAAEDAPPAQPRAAPTLRLGAAVGVAMGIGLTGVALFIVPGDTSGASFGAPTTSTATPPAPDAPAFAAPASPQTVATAAAVEGPSATPTASAARSAPIQPSAVVQPPSARPPARAPHAPRPPSARPAAGIDFGDAEF